MSSKSRNSAAVQEPKPPTTISPSAIISETASLTGTHRITINSNAVLHPRAKLVSRYAPVTIGDGCIICEKTTVGLTSKPDNPEEEEEEQTEVVIEAGVDIEVGAQVEARRVGEGSVVGVNARVGKGAVIGKHCKIGPLCDVREGEVLPDYMVVYGTGQRRIDHSGVAALELELRRKHVDTLRGLIASNLSKWQ